MKRLQVFIAILLVVVLCTACAKTVSLPSLMDNVTEEYAICVVDTIDSMDDFCRLYVLSREDVVQFAACIGNSANEDYPEFVLVQAADDQAAERIETILYSHLNARLSNAIDYAPEAASVLEQSVVTTQGNFVMLIITPDADAVRQSVCKEL